VLPSSEIVARLDSVRDLVERACSRAHRGASGVSVVLASKTQPPEAIEAAYRRGARDFGENYVQEALAKREATAHLADIRWHMIGHLQSNKAKAAVSIFDLIQTLDSDRLVRAIAQAAAGPNKKVLIEVNIGGEASKKGVAPDNVERLIDGSRDFVDIRGLMTIPPPSNNWTEARRHFIRMRELRDRIAASTGLALSELSMGMSDDFEIAIEEGATIVRIGRAVFGERVR